MKVRLARAADARRNVSAELVFYTTLLMKQQGCQGEVTILQCYNYFQSRVM